MSIEITEYYCTKCNSTNLTHKEKALPKVRKISMDELANRSHTVHTTPLVLIQSYKICICEDCGYTVEYLD